MKDTREIQDSLLDANRSFKAEYAGELGKHLAGQSPRVAVLTCSDSRVPPELIFNAGIGELFVIRVAGNVAFERSVLGSLEYAVQHLKVDLILILGHTHCGAVKAAGGDSRPPGAVSAIVREIKQSFPMDSDRERANTLRQTVMLPKRSRIISDAVDTGQVAVKGAIYHLEDGSVEFL